MDEPSHPPTPEPGQQPGQQTGQQPHPQGQTDPFQQAPYGASVPGAVPAYVVAAPPRNPWRTATIVLSVLLGLAVLVITGLVVWIIGFWFSFGAVPGGGVYDDVYEDEWGPSSASGTALEEPCDRFAEQARTLPLFGSGDDAASAVAALGTSAHDVADAARTVEPEDESWGWDAEDWADGWDELGDALDDLGGRLGDDPEARLDVPTWSGGPATVTLGWEGVEGCEIPAVVSALDPENADGFYAEAF